MYIYLFFRGESMNDERRFYTSRLPLNIDTLYKMKNLKELKLTGCGERRFLDSMPTFANLINLKSLVIALLFNICHLYIYIH